MESCTRRDAAAGAELPPRLVPLQCAVGIASAVVACEEHPAANISRRPQRVSPLNQRQDKRSAGDDN